MTTEELIKECLKNNIIIDYVTLIGDELAYEIKGFSKSDTALVYNNANGEIEVHTRYNQVDIINSFEDLAKIAYDWNKAYCDDVYGWDSEWTPIFKKLGWRE